LGECGEPLEAARSHGKAAEWIGVRDPGAAVRHWRRVRELLVDLPETEEILRLHGLACKRILGIGWRIFIPAEEAGRVFAEGRSIADKLGDRVALAGLLDTHTTYRTFFGGDFEELFARATEALRLAEESATSGCRSASTRASLGRDSASGRPRRIAVTELGIALAHGDTELGREVAGYSPLLSLLTFRAFFLFFSGRLAEGAAELERAIARSRAIGDEDSLQFPLGQTSALAYFSGDARSAVPRVLESLEITARIGHRWAWRWRTAASVTCTSSRRNGSERSTRSRRSGGCEATSTIRMGRAGCFRAWPRPTWARRSQEALGLAEEAVGLASEHRWPYPETVASLTLCASFAACMVARLRADRRSRGSRREHHRRDRHGGASALVEVERAELAGLLDDPEGAGRSSRRRGTSFSAWGDGPCRASRYGALPLSDAADRQGDFPPGSLSPPPSRACRKRWRFTPCCNRGELETPGPIRDVDAFVERFTRLVGEPRSTKGTARFAM